MDDNYYMPRLRDVSYDDDYASSFNTAFEDSPVARTPSPLHSKENIFEKDENEKNYCIGLESSVESDSDADSCLTNYDLKQLFQATQRILEREEDILKSSAYELNPSKIDSEFSLDSTLLREEKHALESQHINHEITIAVDKLAYGHASCEEWKVLTPVSNKSKKNNHDLDSPVDSNSNDIKNGSRNRSDESDEYYTNLFYKLVDTLCCDLTKTSTISNR
jgi:hypothetical protein